VIEPNDPRLAAYIARALAELARRDPVTPAERARHAELVARAGKPQPAQQPLVWPEGRL